MLVRLKISLDIEDLSIYTYYNDLYCFKDTQLIKLKQCNSGQNFYGLNGGRHAALF